MDSKEHIVMTPKGKTAHSTTLWIERKVLDQTDASSDVHVAGGAHQGIVVNKQAVSDEIITPPHQLSLEFRVFLVSAQTGLHSQESRTLKFWFRPVLQTDTEQATIAQEFFRELVAPNEFPRDYVGFIKKIMKLLQHSYQGITRIEIILCQQQETAVLPTRPATPDESQSGKHVELTEEKLLEIIESAYPNPVTVQDLSSEYDWSEQDVFNILNDLQSKSIIKAMEHGAYTRVTQADQEIQVVKHMPKMVNAKQPTIAIITALYPEKLAVDSMMDNKETYVRYTTVGSGKPGSRPRFGESNVYTLGTIGKHRVVCTKLPTVGHTREAMTAAGNTTTRLLGTFQCVEYVILVGVAGGVPHYTDYNRHVRLGDVVMSYPTKTDHVYIYCESATEVSSGKFKFETKQYLPPNPILEDTAAQVKLQSESCCDMDKVEWLKNLELGLKELEQESEHNFNKPSAESDKLYMTIGDRELIEVAHPTPTTTNNKLEGLPRLHLGTIGAGRDVARSDQLRTQFSQQYDVLAFDPELDSVIESVLGNCRESFLCVRGICDYKDGTRKSDWQCYASLAAASVTKTIISQLPQL